MRAAGAIAAAGLLISAVPAAAADPQPAASCNAKTTKPFQINEIAANPEKFAGKCVRLKGFWRDFGFYPSAGEAGQPDALSVTFLDARRIGLYLSPADLARAPKTPAPATAFGTVGVCASLGDPAKLTGYCAYKQGAFLAVAGVDLTK